MRQPLFLGRVPAHPYCTQPSGVFAEGVYRRPRETAYLRPHLQVNAEAVVSFLLFDIDDHDAAAAWKRVGVEPWWQCVNPDNGHCHAAWALRVPVLLTARSKPADYLRAVATTMRIVLDADKGYNGLLTKNPIHPAWTTETGGKMVTLGDLAERLPKLVNPAKTAGRPIEAGRGADEGRNAETFWAACKCSHRAVRAHWGDNAGFDAFLFDWCMAFTTERHKRPLEAVEVRGIAKSAAKWTWARFSQAGFSAEQARRGRKGASKAGIASGIARRQANRVRDNEIERLSLDGLSAKEISAVTGTHLRTVYRVRARVRG